MPAKAETTQNTILPQAETLGAQEEEFWVSVYDKCLYAKGYKVYRLQSVLPLVRAMKHVHCKCCLAMCGDGRNANSWKYDYSAA